MDIEIKKKENVYTSFSFEAGIGGAHLIPLHGEGLQRVAVTAAFIEVARRH